MKLIEVPLWAKYVLDRKITPQAVPSSVKLDDLDRKTIEINEET